MAESSNSSGSGNILLAVVIGALLVGIAFFFAMGGFANTAADGDGVTIVDDNPDVNLQIGGGDAGADTPPAPAN